MFSCIRFFRKHQDNWVNLTPFMLNKQTQTDQTCINPTKMSCKMRFWVIIKLNSGNTITLKNIFLSRLKVKKRINLIFILRKLINNMKLPTYQTLIQNRCNMLNMKKVIFY